MNPTDERTNPDEPTSPGRPTSPGGRPGNLANDERIDALFGTIPSARRRAPRRIAAAVVAVAVLAAGTGSVVTFAGAEPAKDYRTAEAQLRPVAATISSVATIESVNQAAVAFPVDGTVASVDVEVGDEVAVGQALASLDVAQLERDLNTRKQTLADAELALAKALAGESTSSNAPGSGSSGSGAVGSGAAVSGSSNSNTSTQAAVATTVVPVTTSVPATAATPTTNTDELAGLQRAVVDAQRAVDTALAESTAALDAAATVCDDIDVAAADNASVATADDTAAIDTSSVSAVSNSIASCQTALAAVQRAQAATAAAQQTLATDSAALDTYRNSTAATPAAGPTGSSSGADSSANSASAGANAGSAASSGAPTVSGSAASGSTTSGATDASSTPSAAELVALQKTVSAAEMQVLVAQQAVARASIVSPIAGTVVAVGIAADDSVTAASSTQMVLIQGTGGLEAVTTVALTKIADVAVGQPASVVPDGSDQGLEGTVVAVAATADSSSGSTSFRVTIGFADADVALGAGTTGTATITTSDAVDAVAVPASAVRWEDGNPTVSIVESGVAESAVVSVGVVGSDWIEITDGIEVGDDVVLADLAEPLPSAATDVAESSSTSGPGGTRSGPPGMGGGGFTAGPPG